MALIPRYESGLRVNTLQDLTRVFDPPLVVHGGMFFHVILQCPVGTATGSEVFRGDVSVNGYFD